jgi:hypothetical protein
MVSYRAQEGNVAIIEFSGNYDRHVNGIPNLGPRAVLAREFYLHHPDIYDFIVVFSSFEYQTALVLN